MTFYKTQIIVTVLSQTPVEAPADLAAIAEEGDSGDYVLDVQDTAEVVELTGEEMAAALTAAGSDPSFFQLDDAGEIGE